MKPPKAVEKKKGFRRTRIPAVLDVPRMTYSMNARLVFEELQATGLSEIVVS